MACDIATQEYHRWFRGNPEFPRKVLVIKPSKTDSFKYQVENQIDLMEYLRRENNTNCYCQIFSNKQIADSTFDTVYIDIDVHDENVPYEKRINEGYGILKTVLHNIHKCGYKESRVYFTGRGFAVYIDFDAIKFNSRSGYRFAVRAFLMEAEVFKSLDSSVLGDVERVARLPNTKNGNTADMYCVQVNPYWTLDQMVEASKACKGYEDIQNKDNDFAKRLKQIEENGNGLFNTVEGVDIERTPVYGGHTQYKNFPKCMQGFYDEITGTGELDHYERINLAIYMMRIWGYEKAKKVLSWANDYNENKTDYQMRYLMSKNMRVYACKKMQQSFTKKGKCWCPYSNMRECAAYRMSKGWIEKILPNFRKEDLNKH